MELMQANCAAACCCQLCLAYYHHVHYFMYQLVVKKINRYVRGQGQRDLGNLISDLWPLHASKKRKKLGSQPF